MNDKKLDYFMNLAKVASHQSSCLKRKVGAVIVDDQFHVLSIGYNGVPKGVEHCIVCKRGISIADCMVCTTNSYDNGLCISIHAEMNSILQCNDRRHAIAIFTTVFPCLNCSKTIANTNIKNIYYCDEHNKRDPTDRQQALELFNTVGICITKMEVLK